MTSEMELQPMASLWSVATPEDWEECFLKLNRSLSTISLSTPWTKRPKLYGLGGTRSLAVVPKYGLGGTRSLAVVPKYGLGGTRNLAVVPQHAIGYKYAIRSQVTHCIGGTNTLRVRKMHAIGEEFSYQKACSCYMVEQKLRKRFQEFDQKRTLTPESAFAVSSAHVTTV